MTMHTDTKSKLIAAANAVKDEDSSSMMLLNFGGGNILVSHDAGVQIIANMKDAQQYYQGYSGTPPEVIPLTETYFTVHMISTRTVKLAKMAQLLKIPLGDLDETLKREDYDPPF